MPNIIRHVSSRLLDQVPRRFTRLAACSVLLMVSVIAPVLASPSAMAATCRTAGHAYLISLPSNTVYFSGYEGDYRNGVPTWTTRAGEQFQFGANGIKPGTSVTWAAVNIFTGQPIEVQQWDRKAGSNCVVNQGPTNPPFSVTAPPGAYELRATYTAGNSGVTYTDLELRVSVVP